MRKVNTWFNDFFGTELKPYQSTIILVLYAIGFAIVGAYLYVNQMPIIPK